MKLNTNRTKILTEEENKKTNKSLSPNSSPHKKNIIHTENTENKENNYNLTTDISDNILNTQTSANKKTKDIHEKYGLKYSIKEYYHPGKFDHNINCDNIEGKLELAWSCCMKRDEKHKVSFIG